MTKNLALWLAVQMLMKVASSEWTLGVQIQQINYIPNVEIREGLYCCCDTYVLVVPCADTFANLAVEQCISECEYYYLVKIRDCALDETCSVTEFYSDTSTAFPLTPVIYPISFEKPELGDQTEVLIGLWDHDSNPHDIVDSFTLPISSPLSVFNQSNPLTVHGYYGLGNLTLTYGNLTMEASTCSSATEPTFEGSCDCSNSPTSLVDQSAVGGGIDPLWISVAILFLLVALAFIAISAVLGYIVYRTRKRDNSLTPKLTKQRDVSYNANEAYNIPNHGGKFLYNGNGTSGDTGQANAIYEEVSHIF